MVDEWAFTWAVKINAASEQEAAVKLFFLLLLDQAGRSRKAG
jgi:hypothetical protein